MKKFVLIIICLKSIFIFGQQTGTFYFSVLGEPCDKKIARTRYDISSSDKKEFKEVASTKQNNNWINRSNSYNTYRFENDSSITIKQFINNRLATTKKRIYKKLNDSIYSFIDYVCDSIIDRKGFTLNILPLIYHGKVEDFYSKRNKHYEAIYNNNRLISNLRWKENGEKDISNVFSSEEVEIEPKYSYGSITEYIEKEVNYPDEALKNHIEGHVILQMIIMEDGSINGIKVLKGVDPLLTAEAIRVIKQSSKKWTPGKIKNTPVRVAVVIPIIFKL